MVHRIVRRARSATARATFRYARSNVSAIASSSPRISAEPPTGRPRSPMCRVTPLPPHTEHGDVGSVSRFVDLVAHMVHHGTIPRQPLGRPARARQPGCVGRGVRRATGVRRIVEDRISEQNKSMHMFPKGFPGFSRAGFSCQGRAGRAAPSRISEGEGLGFASPLIALVPGVHHHDLPQIPGRCPGASEKFSIGCLKSGPGSRHSC